MLSLCRDCSLELGLHPVLVRVCYNFWRVSRILRYGQYCTQKIVHASNGLPAGDIFNHIFIRAYACHPFNGFIIRNSSVALDSYIDDDSLRCAAPSRLEMRTLLSRAAIDLQQVFENELFVGLSWDKLATVSSDRRLADQLKEDLKRLAGTVGSHPCVFACPPPSPSSFETSSLQSAADMQTPLTQSTKNGEHLYHGLAPRLYLWCPSHGHQPPPNSGVPNGFFWKPITPVVAPPLWKWCYSGGPNACTPPKLRAPPHF